MKYIKYILLSLLSLICIIAFLYLKFPKPLQDPDKQIIPPADTQQTTPPESQAQKILDSMSTEQKVGQLFLFGFDGTTLTQSTTQLLHNDYIGGVLLLGKNVSDDEKQVKQLTQEIQSTNTIPLFISIDQEGGIVSRLQWNDTLTKAEEDISNPMDSYTTAEARGEILKNVGINMNLAPVVEYITDPSSFLYDRIYRGTQEEVLGKSIAAIQGYTDSGIISVPKHFPGDSNTSADSHLSLPTVDITKDQWNTYIQPFSNILDQTNVDAIMVGHIEFPNIDNYPASISSEIITNRLVKGLNYTGLVMTDDMEMDALENIATVPNLANKALLAGDDILMYSKDPTTQQEVYNYILSEVKSGNLNIDDKVLKILQIKIKYNILVP